MGKIHNTGQQLRGTGGHCRAKHAHIQPEDGDIVQNTVGNRTGGNGNHRQFWIAVGLDEDLQIIGNDEAGAEGRQTQQVLFDIFQRDFIGTQQLGKLLPKDQHHHRDQYTDPQQQEKVLGKQAICLVLPVLSQKNGNDGGGSHGKHDRQRKQRIGIRDGQIDGTHGVLVDA